MLTDPRWQVRIVADDWILVSGAKIYAHVPQALKLQIVNTQLHPT